jgi:TonB family protein
MWNCPKSLGLSMAEIEARGLCRALRLLIVACMAVALFSARPSCAQTHDHERKVMTRIEPDYPETLKRLYIGGAVRVETVVASDGTVESTKLLGGNPILGQSAIKAIKKWKYAPASGKETVVVKLEFNPYE